MNGMTDDGDRTESLLIACGVLYIDHLAITTARLSDCLRDLLALPGSRLVRGPALNTTQRVRYAFVQPGQGTMVEILEPEADSPIAAQVQRGGGAYHLCYAVVDVVQAVRVARLRGALVVQEPLADPAFDGRLIAFLMLPGHGLVEFVGAYPADAPGAPQLRIDHQPVVPAGTGAATALEAVFRQVFPNWSIAQIRSARLGQPEDWDSLNHLQLLMAVEAEFNRHFAIDEMTRAESFSAILGLLEGH